MTPLQIATRGFLPCRGPAKIAIMGFLGACAAVGAIEAVRTLRQFVAIIATRVRFNG
jgi:hypothetical protein